MPVKSLRCGDNLRIEFSDTLQAGKVELDVPKFKTDNNLTTAADLEREMEKRLNAEVEEGHRVQIAVSSLSPLRYAMRVLQYSSPIGVLKGRKIVEVEVPLPDKADLYPPDRTGISDGN